MLSAATSIGHAKKIVNGFTPHSSNCKQLWVFKRWPSFSKRAWIDVCVFCAHLNPFRLLLLILQQQLAKLIDLHITYQSGGEETRKFCRVPASFCFYLFFSCTKFNKRHSSQWHFPEIFTESRLTTWFGYDTEHQSLNHTQLMSVCVCVCSTIPIPGLFDIFFFQFASVEEIGTNWFLSVCFPSYVKHDEKSKVMRAILEASLLF